MEMNITPNNIKAQYSQKQETVQGQPQMSEAEMSEAELKEKREEREKWLDDMLPFMRKESEYNRLQIELMESDVLAGRLSPNQIQGLLGQELMVRDIQARHFMSQYWAGQKAAMEQDKKEKDLMEAEKKAYEEFMKLPKEEQERIQQEAIATYAEAEAKLKQQTESK